MMRRYINRKGLAIIFIELALITSFLIGAVNTDHKTTLVQAADENIQISSYTDFARAMAAQQKAPFLSEILTSQQQLHDYGTQAKKRFQPTDEVATEGVIADEDPAFTDEALETHSLPGRAKNRTNRKVNQDFNPWPKAGIATAIHPKQGRSYLVVTNDFRQNFNHVHYHFTSNGGKRWSDDVLARSYNRYTEAPFDFQSDPGVAFDQDGNIFLTVLSGNTFSDKNTGYTNFDTEISVFQGRAATSTSHGMYTQLLPTTIDALPCHGLQNKLNCAGQLGKPAVTVDNKIDSSRRGAIYVYYTYHCNGNTRDGKTITDQKAERVPCTVGNTTIPPMSSVIMESHAAGVGKPFSAPTMVSGPQMHAQFAQMVIDSRGRPHIIFNDYSLFPIIRMYQTTLKDGVWMTSKKPLVSFRYDGLNNQHWKFRNTGAAAPGCSIHHDTAYCAFSASQVGGDKATSTPHVYLARIDTRNVTARISRVNTDSVAPDKHHFFAWASINSKGDIYVGWYDNRNDPSGARVEYFVGLSTDGGKTFPRQRAVSDTAFNPCTGFAGCLFFGDSYQLVTGPDDVTHATWADTRDGVSMQIYTQSIKWS